MTELRLLVVATLIMTVIGLLVPAVVGSFADTEQVELTGALNTTYNLFGGGVDLTGNYDLDTDDGSLLTMLKGVELVKQQIPVLFKILTFLYLLILVYAIVKALPFT